MPGIWIGSTALQEDNTSPQYTFGERVTLTRIFRGPITDILTAAPMRGAAGTGIASGYTVAESRVVRERGNVGVLTISYEVTPGAPPGQGSQLPADDPSLNHNEKVERSLKKHPRYSGLTVALLNDVETLLNTDQSSSAYSTAKTNVDASALATELYDKLQRGFTHYVLYVPVFRVLKYYWAPPGGLTAGGFLETPPGIYFTLPTGIDWLREGDQLTFNGSAWVVESKWIGGPDLDADIYV